MNNRTTDLVSPAAFFDLKDSDVAKFFEGAKNVWEAIPNIAYHVRDLTGGKQTIHGKVMEGATIGNAPVYIASGALVEPGAYIVGPAYIGAGAVVRHGAYVRENVILMSGSILGHASEAKNSLFLPNAAAPHFAYVGDSILGQHVNLGAGTKLSNLGVMSEKDSKSGERPSIILTISGAVYNTGLSKFGAILGDNAQTGCNSVLNPGCLIGPRTLVYANTSLRKGYYPPDSIVKLQQEVEVVERRK